MYNKLLNYFENNCCIANIYIKKYCFVWDIVIVLIIAINFIFTNQFVIPFCITMIVMILLFINLNKFMNNEIKKEVYLGKLNIDFLSVLENRKYDEKYSEFQFKRLKKFCIENNLSNDNLKDILQYVDDDLKNKYPSNQKIEIFLSVAIPTVIAIMTVYITNNQIKDMKYIIVSTIFFIIYAWAILYGIYLIRYFLINQRRDLLELKDTLRNILLSNSSDTEYTKNIKISNKKKSKK